MSTLLSVDILGDGEAGRSVTWLPDSGLVLLESSVSGGVGMANCVPFRLSSFLEGESLSGAPRFLEFGGDGEAGGDDTISSTEFIESML
jgi:hypothetical protein